MLKNTGNIALQNLQTFYIFVLRTEKSTLSHQIQLKCGGLVCAQYKYTKILQTSQGWILCILQYFAIKLCNFTNFKMLFPAVLTDFVLLDIKI